MNFNPYFNIGAMALLALVLIHFFYRRQLPTEQSRMFPYLGFCVLLQMLLEIVLAYGSKGTGDMRIWQKQLLPAMSLIVQLLIPVLLFFSLLPREMEERTEYRKRVLLLLFYLLAVSFAMIWQYQRPEILLVGAAEAVSVVLVYVMLQNPDRYSDPVSGLFQSRGFQCFIKEACRKKEGLTCLLIYIRESAGAEEETLLWVARYLKQQPEGEEVFRLGRTEFALILRSERNTEAVVRRIQTRLQAGWSPLGAGFCAYYAILPFVGEQIGSKEILSFIDYTMQHLISREIREIFHVDKLFIRAYHRSLQIDTALRGAVAGDELEVYFQPVMETVSGQCRFAEALVRFPHQTLGLVSPGEFIPIAENSGLIIQIGEQIREKVFRFLREEKLWELGLSHLSVNLSPAELLRDDTGRRLEKQITAWGIKGTHLCFEITESAATHKNEMLPEMMKKFQEKGIRFALDDFGSGYANLDHVMSLPFDILKLDMTMLQKTGDAGQAMVYESVLRMAENLGMETVAEGAETQEDVRRLRNMGADYIQGYYYAKPLSEAEFIDFLKKNNKQEAVPWE